MNEVFKEYSQYYNLLYQDKDYEEESEYITSLIKRYNPNSKFILELGCGTGKHASILSTKGYDVLGIDISKAMLEEAEKLGVNCQNSDVRNFRINQKFDTVISLFHVASYQITNEDLKQYFETAAKHLEKDGIFIFDVWYGPAVLEQKPEYREKILENSEMKIIRKAKPEVHINENCVTVNYDIKVENKSNGLINELKEQHKLRYLFKPELELILENAGFEMVYSKEWISEKDLSSSTWGACFVGVKK